MTTVKTRLFLSRHGDVLTLLGKLTLYVIAFVLSVPHCHANPSAGIQATHLDGGTVVTELSPTIKVP